MNDADLLQQFARDRSEAALAEFVRRHLDLVYGTARRTLGGDADAAKDIAQQVFTDVARRAGELSLRPTLAGWLYLAARNQAVSLVRRERRRAAREQKAYSMGLLSNDDGVRPETSELRPHLDAALTVLRPRDREAVVLRFFEHKPYAEIGVAFSISEDAARLRIERAVEKMQRYFVRRGVTSSAAMIAGVLSAESAFGVPVGLAASVSAHAALAVEGLPLWGVGAKMIHLMTTPKAAALATALLVGSAGSAFYEQRIVDSLGHEQSRLTNRLAVESRVEQDNRSLRAELQQRHDQQSYNQNLAAQLATMPSRQQELSALRAEVKARAAQQKRVGHSPELSANAAQVLSTVQSLAYAQAWDPAAAALTKLVAATEPGSYDRYLAEDTLAKVEWQGRSNHMAARSEFEDVAAMLRLHPDYDVDGTHTSETAEWLRELNLIIGMKAVKTATTAPNQEQPVSPDGWFPGGAL